MDLRTPKEGKKGEDYVRESKIDHKYYVDICNEKHLSVFISPHFVIYTPYVGLPFDKNTPSNELLKELFDDTLCYSTLLNLKLYEKKYYNVEMYDIFVCLHNSGSLWVSSDNKFSEKLIPLLANVGKIPPPDKYGRHILTQATEEDIDVEEPVVEKKEEKKE